MPLKVRNRCFYDLDVVISDHVKNPGTIRCNPLKCDFREVTLGSLVLLKWSAVPTGVIFEELPHPCHIKNVEIVTKRLK